MDMEAAGAMGAAPCNRRLSAIAAHPPPALAMAAGRTSGA